MRKCACDAFVCANDRVAAYWMQTLLEQESDSARRADWVVLK
jgi:hypothetical protein